MHASIQAPLPLEIREFMESASQESSAHANGESSPVPETSQATKEKDQTNEDVETEKKEGAEEAEQVSEKEGAEEGEQVSKLLPERLSLGHGEEASQSPKQESSSRSPKQSPKQESASSPVKVEVPPLVCISIPRKKQPLSLARAAGEKVSVGFKMDEVEAMAAYPTQQDKLLDNVLGGWDPRRKCFRKLRYALALLKEVDKCGGAPIKHKNWTIVRVMKGREKASWVAIGRDHLCAQR